MGLEIKAVRGKWGNGRYTRIEDGPIIPFFYAIRGIVRLLGLTA
jgi:hypothetical protein